MYNFLRWLSKREVSFGFSFIKDLLYKRNIKRAITYWNSNAYSIIQDIDNSKDKEEAYFKWMQLVYQEIQMFCMQNKKSFKEDIEVLSERRGFNNVQKQFLIDITRFVFGNKSVL